MVLEYFNFLFVSIRDKFFPKIMRISLLSLFLAGFLLLSNTQIIAQTQDRPIWVSLRVGQDEYRGDYGSEFFDFRIGSEFTFGYSLSAYLNSSLDLSVSMDAGILDAEIDIDRRTTESFSKPFINTNLQLRYNLSNGYILRENTAIQPYLSTGLGVTFFTGDGDREVNGEGANIIPSGRTISIPVGIGFEIPVSNAVSLNAQSTFNRTFAEGFDGRDRLDNRDHDDFLIHTIGIKFSLSGSKGKGSGKVNEPTDTDRIPDPVDDTPIPENETEEPDDIRDSDGDGLNDSADRCPQVAGVDYLSGCPDSDGDRIGDSNDECPETAGDYTLNGCPDDDGDDIINKQDECPKQAGIADLNGCPEAVDSDGDGINDADDRCPDRAGIDKNDGCPTVVLKDIQQELKRIADNIKFGVGKTTLLESSLDDLNKVAQIMREDLNLRLFIDAYTDSEGNAAYNLQLSNKRAKAVKQYLVNQGISEDRLTAEGYGEILPVASNDTAAGRSQNRRIELRLSYF